MIKKLSILSLPYTVTESDLSGSGALGLFLADERIIKISDNVDDFSQRAVFLHELVHACEYYGALKLTEEQVEVFGNILFSIMVDNSELIRWIAEGKIKK